MNGPGRRNPEILPLAHETKVLQAARESSEGGRSSRSSDLYTKKSGGPELFYSVGGR